MLTSGESDWGFKVLAEARWPEDFHSVRHRSCYNALLSTCRACKRTMVETPRWSGFKKTTKWYICTGAQTANPEEQYKTLVSELMLGKYSLLTRQGSCLPFADSVCPLVHHGRRYWYMRTKVKTPHYFLPSCRYRQRWVWANAPLLLIAQHLLFFYGSHTLQYIFISSLSKQLLFFTGPLMVTSSTNPFAR